MRNVKLYYQGWLPEEDVKAVLLVVHGMGEHSGRYMNVVDNFVPLGYAVYGLDHLGLASQMERVNTWSVSTITPIL